MFRGSPVIGTFFIDLTVGRDTSVTVSHSDPVNVTITSPANVTYERHSHPQQFLLDEESGVLKILLNGTVQVR